MPDNKVLIDLNFPDFQDQLFSLEQGEHRVLFKTLRKLRSLSWPSVYRDKGLNWEQIKDQPGRFTIRLSKRSRAVVRREGDHIRFISLHTDHDGAYARK
jgi:hypothetical protein